MNVPLKELDLVDAPAEPSFDNLTALASQVIGTPVSLISIVDFEGERQFFKSQIGLMDPWATERQTPLTHSFCQYVVRSNDALVIDNAPEHSLVKDNAAIPDLGVQAYLGVPVYAPGNQPVGALCVIDHIPRTWLDQEIAMLQKLSACVSDAISLTAALKTSERLNKEQRLFTYGFSQDLKAPASSLRLALEEISEEPDISADGREIVGDGIAMVDRMAEQVEDVLAFTRYMDLHATFAPVDLSILIDSVLVNLNDVIQRSAAKVLHKDLPVVQGKEAQLKQLFHHLIDNAIKFVGKDITPQITVTADETDQSYVITVQDNGVGIAPEHQSQIFDLFERLFTRSDYPGTGIGLALCRRVAENHNGNMSLFSAPGRGSAFSVTLPKDPA